MNKAYFFVVVLVLMLLSGCGGNKGTTGNLFSPFAGKYSGTLDCTITGSQSHQTSIHKFDFVLEIALQQGGWVVVYSKVIYRPTGEFVEGVFTQVDFDDDMGPHHVKYFWFEMLNPPGKSLHGIDKIYQNTQLNQDPNNPGGLLLEDGTYEGPISADMIGSEHGTGPNFPQGSGGVVGADYRLEMQKVMP